MAIELFSLNDLKKEPGCQKCAHFFYIIIADKNDIKVIIHLIKRKILGLKSIKQILLSKTFVFNPKFTQVK